MARKQKLLSQSIGYRSNARTFIKHYADKDDLDKLIALAQARKAKLNN